MGCGIHQGGLLTVQPRVTAYILALFLLALDLPGLIWLLLPSPNGEAEAVKIVCVVFVGGFVNLFGSLAGWKHLNMARDEWGRGDALLCRFFQANTLWGLWLFVITYLKQWLFPL